MICFNSVMQVAFFYFYKIADPAIVADVCAASKVGVRSYAAISSYFAIYNVRRAHYRVFAYVGVFKIAKAPNRSAVAQYCVTFNYCKRFYCDVVADFYGIFQIII